MLQTDDQKLKHIFNLDQNIRQTIDSLMAANAPSEKLMLSYQKMAEQDSYNQKIALPILDRYLTGEITLSEESLYALYYIIQHADGDIQVKYQDFIKKLFDKQIISNVEYGMFADRMNVRQNKAQLFGFQCYMDAYIKDKFLYPLSTSAKENRAELDMEDSNYSDLFSGEYAPLFVSPSEYVIFGHVLRQTGKSGEYNGIFAEVSVGNIKILTNHVGFYAIKLNKEDVPTNIDFSINGKQYSRPIQNKADTDWEIINVLILQ